MFNMNRYKVEVLLITGQTIKFHCKNIKLMTNENYITEYTFHEPSIGISIPPKKIAAVYYELPIFKRLWKWIWN